MVKDKLYFYHKDDPTRQRPWYCIPDPIAEVFKCYDLKGSYLGTYKSSEVKMLIDKLFWIQYKPVKNKPKVSF